MSFGPHYYHKFLRKYVSLFGSYFSEMTIKRPNGDKIIVPLTYGPSDKDLIKRKADPVLDQGKRVSQVLPKMTFENTTMMYDGTRAIMQTQRILGSKNSVNFAPAPYNIDFTLYVAAQNIDDGNQIIEQILPYFQPSMNRYVELLEGFEPVSINTVLTSVSLDDAFEGAFEERRTILWTLTFNMKCWFFGPTKNSYPVIKFVDVEFNDKIENVGVRPGLTVDGEPTTDVAQSIPFREIEKDDNWALITMISEEDLP